jgi:phenylpropionate dioxygenase-like ring-hydroxylating dioxygenase large terminal subunit
MLTPEDNELLTRTDRGTPMGEAMRRFWLPILLAEELPEPDCPPVRVRVVGENLIAFRATDGSIGLLEEICPHRRASLFWGRNEEQGLRCVYHGWKFDTAGQCVDMPNEPAEYEFKRRVQTRAYPAREFGGMIWAYMGPKEAMPELPQLEWARVPASHRYLSKRLQESNWAQATEGGIDSSHISFLHSRIQPPPTVRSEVMTGVGVPGYVAMDTNPHFTVKRTDYGLLIGARRNAEKDKYYWRITQFLLPFHQMIPGNLQPGSSITGHAWLPIDDDHCWAYTMTWNPERPLSEEELATLKSGNGVHAEVDAKYRPIRNARNEYLIDRVKQKTESFTGIKGVGEQDCAVQESMGSIVDRSLERLGTSDTAIIAFRRLLLNTVRDLDAGKEPYAAAHGDAYRVRSASVVLESTIAFDEGARENLIARV